MLSTQQGKAWRSLHSADRSRFAGWLQWMHENGPHQTGNIKESQKQLFLACTVKDHFRDSLRISKGLKAEQIKYGCFASCFKVNLTMLWTVATLTKISHILVFIFFIDIYEAPPLQKPSSNHNDLVLPSKPLNLFPLANTGHITLILFLNHTPISMWFLFFLYVSFILFPGSRLPLETPNA